MIFTLEALQADKGDCLILHYGAARGARYIVIDGGPKDVFRKGLEPRLEQLRGASGSAALPLEMVVVSHVDDDHIQGVLDLFTKLAKLASTRKPLPYRIDTLWHNGFDDVLGNRADEVFSRLPAVSSVEGFGSAGATAAPDYSGDPAIASITQGRDLRQLAEQLDVKANAPFEGLVMLPQGGKAVVPMAGGLSLTVVAPAEDRAAKLAAEWEKQVKSHKWQATEGVGEAQAFTDTSLYNLSSIAVLAEFEGKRILLTGDARGDDILKGLATSGLARGGSIHVDVFKLPHHGSSRNASPEMFSRIIADHYVISANGENGNPDPETLGMIHKARGGDTYTIHLTNHEGPEGLKAKLDGFFATHPAPNRKVVYREASALGMKIDLLDAAEA